MRSSSFGVVRSLSLSWGIDKFSGGFCWIKPDWVVSLPRPCLHDSSLTSCNRIVSFANPCDSFDIDITIKRGGMIHYNACAYEFMRDISLLSLVSRHFPFNDIVRATVIRLLDLFPCISIRCPTINSESLVTPTCPMAQTGDELRPLKLKEAFQLHFFLSSTIYRRQCRGKNRILLERWNEVRCLLRFGHLMRFEWWWTFIGFYDF